ncbi:3-ketoacyl-(acyl-carrier-protein) reductase [Neobacillus bataviensis LMG 21833]|uniref:3-ketoacyl-(Acyl-carrier-protein) reductase n=1 Tax=Neobacillus bataviensis LMG 21833 TaxID=1117379 RepID=K6D7I1_9BACI|nr:SDR family oxidoreductase [Neobacillus bataviensis]EKN64269.1 3-ketoacyl-(acyl-carrier-protein) reductase [Neobacillus bataviensis LMG 21833]
MRLKDKVSIITGGSQGIGEAIARKAGEHGAKVVIADINEETGEKALDCLKSDGIDAVFVKADVSREQDVIHLMDQAIQQFGGIDVLVNNAAATMRKSVVETTLEEWNRVMNVNLTGTFLCSKYAIPEIEKRGGGAIVNIASWHAYRTITRLAAYAASKGGMTALTRQMALDCGKMNIRVNAVCPSTVDTPMLYETFKNLPDPDEAFQETLKFQPLGRISTGEDIANACLFLMSDEASYISGHSLMVDGAAFVKLARPLMFD